MILLCSEAILINTKSYQELFDLVKKKIARSGNFPFEISSIFFIGIVKLNIIFEIIIFYIIQVNSLFLLYHRMINNLRISLNNLINQIVSFNCSHPIICWYSQAFLRFFTFRNSFIIRLFMSKSYSFGEIELYGLHLYFKHLIV